ncbi:MAG: dihydrofolate reductase [Candidatus Omnitrophica bacterium]|nr:dihydrofolate reductase [Candidatus Omnitrophota bacterium]
MSYSFNIIVAVDSQFGIGKSGLLPWHLKGDLKYFKERTSHVDTMGKKNMVAMGRKTWESIPQEFRPLSGRLNVVLSINPRLSLPDGVLRCENLQQVMDQATVLKDDIESVFIIGGATVYKEAILMAECRRLYITHILRKFECDSSFPKIPPYFKKNIQSDITKEGEVAYYFAEYERLNP